MKVKQWLLPRGPLHIYVRALDETDRANENCTIWTNKTTRHYFISNLHLLIWLEDINHRKLQPTFRIHFTQISE